ncbi:HNH endonuclease [Marilutibacter maris]|uniref:HNH endonuclease n=1 Tax=Marilutibacter maris TaxID=1605891 RepID=UPI000DA9D3CA
METDRAPLRLILGGASGPAPRRDPDSPAPHAGGIALRSTATGPRPVPRNAIERLNSVRLLSLDACGRVLDWMSWQDAACLYARDAVAWTLGEPCLRVHGGTSRLTGEQSVLDLPPIIAARGHARASALDPTPALTNAALFARDSYLCLYCGQHFSRPHLTRDHVQPVSKGGRDIWENVVSACFSCNSRKGNRTPQQAHMPLLAVPYRPSWVEHLILSNRNILADQMTFLRSQLPKNTRLVT